MSTREERMRHRLRGAVRHEVEDISFGLFAPEPEPDNEGGAEAQITPPRQTTPPIAVESAPAKSPPTLSNRQPGTVQNTPRSSRKRPRRSDPYEITSEHDEQASGDGNTDEDDVLALLPPQPTGRRSVASRRSLGSSDVVQESPVHAPGSGRRMSIDTRGMRSSSQKMQRILHSVGGEEEGVGGSSPLAMKSRRSGSGAHQTIAGHSPRTVRLSRAVVRDDDDDEDELSPNASKTARQDEDGAEEIDDAEAARILGKKRPRRSTARISSPLLGSQEEPEGSPREPSVVEEVEDEAEPVAEEEPQEPPPTRQRRKRQPTSAKQTQPEEDSGEPDVVDEVAEEAGSAAEEEAPPKRQRKKRQPSPAKQRQPEESPEGPSVVEEVAEEAESAIEEESPPKRQKRKRQSSPAKQKQPVKKQRAPRQKKREKAAKAARPDDTSADEMGNNDAAVIPITIQRFKKPRRHHTEGTDADILAADIPFSNQKGVNVVDVLAQSSEEVIGTCLEQLANALENAEASSARKELRVKMKALEAFGEEVRTRLLTHTIMLDNLYSLRQRVREAEITRNKLRDSILRHREEQEQLHIRMDAERDAHDENRKFLANRMDMSSSLHAIRQAVEQGKAEDEKLNPSEVLKANLAMLEVNVPDLAGKVCRTSDQGGLMQQVLRFNGFLERAAVELERRPRTSGSRLLT